LRRRSDAPTFAQLVQRYKDEYLVVNCKQSTAKQVLWNLKIPLQHFGQLSVDVISESDIEVLADRFAAAYKINTQISYVSAIAAVFRWGLQQGLVSHNPVSAAIITELYRRNLLYRRNRTPRFGFHRGN
jgi:hypothetical protein